MLRMARANPLWGAPRIHGELLKLGIEISERTVSRLMPRRPGPPSQAWHAFLANHIKDIVSVDFFTVPTASFRVLFVFLVLAHDRRRVLHFNVTDHPTADWTVVFASGLFGSSASLCQISEVDISEQALANLSKNGSTVAHRLSRRHMPRNASNASSATSACAIVLPSQ